jgi:1-deoxy-D-xylulose-5-phosphate synthase
VGIAEAHGVTFAAGLAMEGFKPVVAIYSTFLQRAYDQIVHDVCLESHNVVFAIDRGGLVGEDGPTHHGIFDYSYLRCLPNMVVMAPKDENELQRMLKTALDHNGPIAIRYPRGLGEGVEVETTMRPLEIGKAEVLFEGDDVVLLAIGSGVREAVKAHNILEKEDIQATVVNCRFVKPLDQELILSLVERIPKVVTIEENVLQGGFGSAVLECIHNNGPFNFRIKRIGIEDTFVEHGSQTALRSRQRLDAKAIADAVLSII